MRRGSDWGHQQPLLPQTHTPAVTLRPVTWEPRPGPSPEGPGLHHSASEPASTGRQQLLPRLCRPHRLTASGARPGGLSSANPETN